MELHPVTLFTFFFRFNYLEAQQPIEVTFSARGLPYMDPFLGSPDPYARTYFSPTKSANYTFTGETGYCSNTFSCSWSLQFKFKYENWKDQRVKVHVYDDDFGETDDYIGSIEFSLNDLMTSEKYVLEKGLVGVEDAGYVKAKGRTIP